MILPGTTRNRILVAVALVAVGTLCFGYRLGVRVNASPSVALGLWRATARPIAVGEYVLVCPPNNELLSTAQARGYLGVGTCPGALAPLVKLVAGLAGDHVVVDAEGIRVNGRLLPHSKPLTKDGAGRPLFAFTPSSFVLKAGEMMLYGDGTRYSFDGRYFGPVPQRFARAVVVPFLTVPAGEDS